MKNKHILKALSLLAAVCIAAGCRGSTTAETTAGTGIQTETSIVSETTTAAESVSAEVEELEVDHVDEDGIVYYKNPTEWTYEMVYEALTIEGKKVQAPLTFEDFGDKYSLHEETLTYFEKEKQVSLGIEYNGNKIGGITFVDCNSADDIKNKEINFLYLNLLQESSQLIFSDITVNKVGFYSTRDDIIKALGVPYREVYYDGDVYSIAYKYKEKLSLVFVLNNNEVIEFYILLND